MTAPEMTLSTSVEGLASLVGVFYVLVTLSIAMRFIARSRQRVSYGPDDWLMAPVWIFFTGLSIASIYSMANHFAGYYAPKNKADLLAIHPTMLKTYWSIDLLAILIFGFVKLSALFFYRRIFCSSRNSGVFNIVTWVAIAIVVAWEICFFVMTFLVCGPNLHNLFYNASTVICTILFPYYEGTVISDFLLDVLILVMPIPLIWRLHTNMSRKLAVTGVFMFALAGVGASCARMVITMHLVTVGKAIDDEDIYQSNTLWQYFIILEAGFTTVAANLPSLWYFTTGVSPASVLRSVRSLVSLGSSTKSKQSKTEGSSSFKLQNTDASFSSQTAVSESHVQVEPIEQYRAHEQHGKA